LLALGAGVDTLLKRVLPSAWSPTGGGWQEHWPDAPRAGFYASCDGLIALARARAFVPLDFESITAQVLSQHLTPFVTGNVTPPDERAEHERAVVLTTTMKLAKYLQAYGAAGRPAAALRPAKFVARTLLREGRRLKTGWSYVLGDPKPAVVPTMEAVLGLRAAGLEDEAVTGAACDALAAIDWRAQLKGGAWTITDFVMWPVAITELSLIPRRLSRKDIAQCMTRVIGSDEAFQHAHWFRRFVNRRADTNDYYSANVTLLLASAVLRLVAADVLNDMYIRLTDSVVVQVATGLATNGVFQTTDKVYFWENAQALFLLDRYLETMESIAMPVSSGLFVSPRYFTTTRFAYDPKLATILMPFGADWASDVYTAFADTVKAAKFKAWRADEEHTDDVIIQTIWRRINESRFVIADCTGRNPNVFYELGIAHTIGKPVFICAQERNDIPFDVSAIRSTVYKVTPTGIGKLKSELAHFIEEVKKL
jgi:hypothetical protein